MYWYHIHRRLCLADDNRKKKSLRLTSDRKTGKHVSWSQTVGIWTWVENYGSHSGDIRERVPHWPWRIIPRSLFASIVRRGFISFRQSKEVDLIHTLFLQVNAQDTCKKTRAIHAFHSTKRKVQVLNSSPRVHMIYLFIEVGVLLSTLDMI